MRSIRPAVEEKEDVILEPVDLEFSRVLNERRHVVEDYNAYAYIRLLYGLNEHKISMPSIRSL